MNKSKKIMCLILCLFWLVGCGSSQNETVDNKQTDNESVESLNKFDTQGTIEKCVLYDENNIKITANELSYSNFSANLSVTIENNSNKNYSFSCGSMGYSVNSINGYMIEDGYLNIELEPGKSSTDDIKFKFDNLFVYGISCIADINIGFNISDDDYNSIQTGALSIKTSLDKSYDYEKNTYNIVMNNGQIEEKFNCKVKSFNEDELYNEYNVKIISSSLVTNKDNENSLLLEIENNAAEPVYVTTKNVKLNGIEIYDSLCSADVINANTKLLSDISLESLLDKYDGDKSNLKIIKEISFEFSVGDSYFDTSGNKQITISLPQVQINTDAE